MYSHSSGAALALHAAHGRPVAKLVLQEPPYVPGSQEEQRTQQEISEKLKTLWQRTAVAPQSSWP